MYFLTMLAFTCVWETERYSLWNYCSVILAHLSWKLKWISLIACFLSSSRLSVNINFSRTTGQILSKLGSQHPWVKGESGPRPFSRGDDNEIEKIHWRNFKIFFSRTTGPISTKLGTKHLWAKKTQGFSIRTILNISRMR